MPCKKKAVPISIPELSHVSNVICLLLFVKLFYILSFAHLKLITWLDVSWSYLPPVQGSECHNESRKMSPDQFLFSPHTLVKKQRNSSQGTIKRSFHWHQGNNTARDGRSTSSSWGTVFWEKTSGPWGWFPGSLFSCRVMAATFVRRKADLKGISLFAALIGSTWRTRGWGRKINEAYRD